MAFVATKHGEHSSYQMDKSSLLVSLTQISLAVINDLSLGMGKTDGTVSSVNRYDLVAPFDFQFHLMQHSVKTKIIEVTGCLDVQEMDVNLSIKDIHLIISILSRAQLVRARDSSAPKIGNDNDDGKEEREAA